MSYCIGGSSAPKIDEVACVVPDITAISPRSKLLECADRVYDNPVSLREGTQPSIPLVENVCYATNLQVSDREVETSKNDEEGSKPVLGPTPSPVWKPAIVASVPVALFGRHVEMKHRNNNRPFITEFAVRDH